MREESSSEGGAPPGAEAAGSADDIRPTTDSRPKFGAADVAAVLRALDPFWTRAIAPDDGEVVIAEPVEIITPEAD